ncbi:hypothetical protein C1645_751368 [Glomus cerebriforme]|uniref:Organic solute transporter Ostalpha-domain-containing protein n=1 Tax=Glomus cerebriforme TaxID=658196 RepID=A0A397TS07_9GLOM|nr:hypothetical protein C1645_751368 [Glomus cerebriforme]
MSTISEQPPSPIQYHSIPTLIPSICFFVAFTFMSSLHLVKYIKLRRAVYLYLFIFSILRTCLFAFRIAWSPNPDSIVLGVISNVLLMGGFFVIFEALCILLSDWLILLIEKRTISLPKYEVNSIKFLQLILPLFSIIGALGEIFGHSYSYDKLSSILRQTSALGFLSLIIIYIILVTYFALKYGEDAIRKQLKTLVLFISAALLLIELVYRTFVSFMHETTPIFYYEWVFYVFECLPEIVLLLILGEVILGEWFYNVEDDNKLKTARQLAKFRSKGKFGVSILSENNRDGGSTVGKDGKTILQTNSIIIINMNDDGKLVRTDTTNTTNTNASSTNSTNSNV